MKPVLLAGTIIVNLALIFYAIGISQEQIKKMITRRVVMFLTLGVVFDVTATVCMIIGSSSGPFTLHGLLGYSSLSAMLVETLLAWRHYVKWPEKAVSRGLHLYSRIALTWWVLAYITGAILVFLVRSQPAG